MNRFLTAQVARCLSRLAARATVSTLALAGLALPGFAATPTAAMPTATPASIASSDLRTGMKGYGLTVIKGTKIERFGVEVIGVLKNALPKQDMILIRCSGLGLEHSGVVAGMSGSPIYVTTEKGDLLVGALSYGFPFNKDPVAGVTPIADMLPELDRKLVPIPSNQKILPMQAAKVHVPGAADMVPVAVPLTISGVHPEVVDSLRGDLASLGFDVVQVATGGSAPKPAGSTAAAQKFEPGSAISLVLARGDMAISGIGTITWVKGDHFIAFGHPFKGLGQVHLPVGGADIQWILASQSSSFKMGTALEDFGVLDQDRQPAVAGRTGQRAQMVPFRVAVTNTDRKETTVWNVEVTDQPLFFPMAAAMVIGNAVRTSEPIAENVALEMKLKFTIDGPFEPIVLEDTLTGLGGMASVGEINGVVNGIAKALVFNGFERLRVARVDAEFQVADDRNIVFLEGARTASEEVEVGKPITIHVDLQRANAGMTSATLVLPPLPAELAGTTLTVQIGAERAMPPESPEPGNIRDLVDFLRKQPPHNRLAAVVTLPEPTLLMRGARLVGLPLGVRDEMAGHQVQTRAGRETLRTSIDLPWTINGGASLKLRVRDVR
jgi:hypothetical protein